MSPDRKQRIFRILRLFTVILVFLLLFLPFALGFFTIWLVTHAPCGPNAAPESHGMMDYEAVTFYSPALDRDISGYFVRGSNGVTIIIPPTLGSGAGSWRQEHIVLNQNGYNLFNYESRNCLGYANTLGYSEVNEVGDALDYLATRPDVDMDKIGIHGFSAGGATSIMAAARYPQIKAVIAMGGYHDFSAMMDAETAGQWYGLLYNIGGRLAYRLGTGLDMTVLSPISVIDQIPPRAIQLIYGNREPSLPGAYQQQAAAGPSAQLWEVDGATHGAYWSTAPQMFETTVLAFLDSAFGIARTRP